MKALKKHISYLKRKGKILVSKHFEKQLFVFERRRIQSVLKKNKELILVYTIGKVGSSSVYESLKKNKQINIPIFHIHTLNRKRIQEQKKYYLSSVRNSVPFHLVQSSVLAELLRSYNGKIYIFTLIREPLQREISSIFQDSFNFTMSSQVEKNGMEQVVRKKMEKLFQKLPENEWFEQELKQIFGFDIFSENFDFQLSKNYLVATRGKHKLALARLENIDQSFDEVCQQLFCTDKSFKLLHKNLGKNKFYEKDYANIKQGLSFSEKEIEKVVGSKFIQKFYPDHIAGIRKKMCSDNLIPSRK